MFHPWSWSKFNIFLLLCQGKRKVSSDCNLSPNFFNVFNLKYNFEQHESLLVVFLSPFAFDILEIFIQESLASEMEINKFNGRVSWIERSRVSTVAKTSDDLNLCLIAVWRIRDGSRASFGHRNHSERAWSEGLWREERKQIENY